MTDPCVYQILPTGKETQKTNMPKVADIHIHDFGCFGIYIGPGFVRTWILFTLDALLVYYPSDKLHISFLGKNNFLALIDCFKKLQNMKLCQMMWMTSCFIIYMVLCSGSPSPLTECLVTNKTLSSMNIECTEGNTVRVHFNKNV